MFSEKKGSVAHTNPDGMKVVQAIEKWPHNYRVKGEEAEVTRAMNEGHEKVDRSCDLDEEEDGDDDVDEKRKEDVQNQDSI
jgi:hypothetical protein